MKTTMTVAAATVMVTVLGAGAATNASRLETNRQFDHTKHSGFDCTACHTDVARGQFYPEPSFCAACHDGRVQPEIDWAPPTPGSRANLRFQHAPHVRAVECGTCHAQGGQRTAAEVCLGCHGIAEHQAADSPCTLCHVQPPAPASHEGGFRERHRVQAAATPETCATCHVRSDCLDCHRPGAASPTGGYHPADYLASHPVAAYSQETTCADCHNVGAFCATCHQRAGLTITGVTGSGYHDGTGFFVGGHGQAARQSLESCVACHTEQDCLKCHVNLNPHGPDFDAQAQREAAAAVCAVCHGGL
jgi:hypothetical protein